MSADRRSGRAPAPAVEPRVLVLNFDPIVRSRGERRLHRVAGWNDPRAPGRTEGKLNNWWAYATDFNRFPESR